MCRCRWQATSRRRCRIGAESPLTPARQSRYLDSDVEGCGQTGTRNGETGTGTEAARSLRGHGMDGRVLLLLLLLKKNKKIRSWLFVMLILMYAFIVVSTCAFLIVKWILMLIMYSAASSFFFFFTGYSAI